MNNEGGIFNLIYNNINLVYGAMIKVLQGTPNFEVLGEEPAVHAVHVAVGKSFFGSGDELTITLEPIDENKTKMHVTCDNKVPVDYLRSKYGDVIQKLVDRMSSILPPPVKEEAPKPNNMVQVGELSKQMEMQANGGIPIKQEPTSVNQILSQPLTNNEPVTTQQQTINNQMNTQQVPNNSESTYAYEPKPFDYESLKENESSKHQGNDPLQDLMKNL